MRSILLGLSLVSAVIFATDGRTADNEGGATTLKRLTDSVHAVIEADRIAYTRNVVNRLHEAKIIKATEHWKDEKTLPLPAQMMRMGAETIAEKKLGFTYALLSPFPINKQNAPRTEAEKAGLKHIYEAGTNYYGTETLGGKRYYAALYPDRAIAKACIDCHNGHAASPKHDFKMDDIMGGIIVRVLLDN